ncbi:MAG TPA: cupin domain-containing protein [Conexibacter sp.]|nr:cupin domain-containing protein [Conexibacter sp.]
MATVGEAIENPVSGERIVWIETAASSGGELLAADLHLRRGAAVAATHRHPRQDERFRVDAGRVTLEIEDERRDLAVGDEATVPAGAAHRWWNSGDGEATVRVELRPALDTETFFETFFGLARDGKTNSEGVPDLLQIAVAYRELGDSCPVLTKPPAPIQRVLFAVLAPLGRMRGRRAVYAGYSPGHPKL